MPYQFKKPEVKDEEYPEYIRNKIALAEKINTEYTLSDFDNRLIRFEQQKKAFGDTLVTFVAALRKVKYDQPGTPNREWLVYKIIETIRDRDKKSHSIERWYGFHTEPMAEVQRNQLDEVTDTVIEGERIIYDIPFSRKAVQEVLDIKTRSNTPSNIAIGEGMATGTDNTDPIRGNPLSVFNLENFIQFKYDYLEGANRDGSLIPSYEGMLNYLDKMGIRYDEALYEGEKIPQTYLATPQGTTGTTAATPSIQDQEQQLAKAKYKQTEARQKSQQ